MGNPLWSGFLYRTRQNWTLTIVLSKVKLTF